MAYSPTMFTDSMGMLSDDQEESMGYQSPVPPVSAPPSSRTGLPRNFSLRNTASQPAAGTMLTSTSFDNLYQRTQPPPPTRQHQEYNPVTPSMPNQMFSPFQSQPTHSASWTSMPTMEGLSLNSSSPNKRKIVTDNGGVVNLRSSTMSPDSGSSNTPMLPDLSGSRSPLFNSNEILNRVDIHTMTDEQHLIYIKRRGPIDYYDMNDPQLNDYRMENLCGLQDVDTALTQNIIDPLQKPQAYSLPGLYQTLLWFDGKSGCGIRSAILAKLQGVCNILIYRTIDDGKLPDEMFFVDMLLFAIRKSPCAVVMHRADAAFASHQTKNPDGMLEGVRLSTMLLRSYSSAWKRIISTPIHKHVWSIHVQQFNPSLYDNYYRPFFVSQSRAVAKVPDMRKNMTHMIDVFKVLLNRYLDFSQNEAIDKDAYINQISLIIQTRLTEYKQEQPKLEFVKRPRDLIDIITEVILSHRATVGMAPVLPSKDLFGVAVQRKREMVQREMATRAQGEQLKMQA